MAEMHARCSTQNRQQGKLQRDQMSSSKSKYLCNEEKYEEHDTKKAKAKIYKIAKAMKWSRQINNQ